MFTENNDWLAPTLVAVGVVLVFVCTAILIVLWRIMQIMKIMNVTRHARNEVSVGMIRTNREQSNICYLQSESLMFQVAQVDEPPKPRQYRICNSGSTNSSQFPASRKSDLLLNYVNGSVAVDNEQRSPPRAKSQDPLIYTEVMPANHILKPDRPSDIKHTVKLTHHSPNV